MPFIQCRKRKGWHKVDMEVCFDIKCPNLKFWGLKDPICTFKSKTQNIGGEKEMKITLIYPDLGEEATQCLLEWIRERMDNKSPENLTPLRYVDDIEVER